MLVVVTGLPGSGKSTLSHELAARLALPLIAKDRYKEILFDVLGIGDRSWSRQLGLAAIALQYDAMATIRDAVVDSGLWPGVSEPKLAGLRLPMTQVFCDCPFELARDRYFSRPRHAGFVAEQMTVEDYEMFRPLMEPLALDAPLVRVPTFREVDYNDLVQDISALGVYGERTNPS
jgi:hypothetical protein